MIGLLRALWLAAALALVTVPISELLFYPVPWTNVPALLVFYAVIAALPALLVERWPAPLWITVSLGGGIFGWLIEGVLVWQTYEAVPFSLVWTPLAWHMVMSVGVAVCIFRWALLSSKVWAPLVSFAGFGVLMGLWGAYGWAELISDAGAAETPDFPGAVLGATLLIGLGHLLLDYLPESAPPRWLMPVLLALAVLVWAVSWALPMFPVSLFVPVLIALSVFALARHAQPARSLAFGRVRPLRYLWLTVFVLAATVSFETVQLQPWITEMNAFMGGPLMLIGAGLWSVALLAGFRRKT